MKERDRIMRKKAAAARELERVQLLLSPGTAVGGVGDVGGAEPRSPTSASSPFRPEPGSPVTPQASAVTSPSVREYVKLLGLDFDFDRQADAGITLIIPTEISLLYNPKSPIYSIAHYIN